VQPFDLLGTGEHRGRRGAGLNRGIELLGDAAQVRLQDRMESLEARAVDLGESDVREELGEQFIHDFSESEGERRTTSTSDRGAWLYSCSLYWIFRVLIPRISDALDVAPPVAFMVSRIT